MKRLARACLTGAVLCLAVSPATAHPPDLPVDTKDVCVPDGGWYISGGIRIFCPGSGVSVPSPDCDYGELNTRKPCEPLDATSPLLGEVIGHFLQSFTLGLGGVPVVDLDLAFFGSTLGSPVADDFIDQCTPLAGGAIVSGSMAASSAPAKIDEGQRAHARKLYLIGERCRRCGDFNMAENCYQETKLLCPGCDYARKAERRIREVRAMRAAESEDIGEESEPPKDESSNRPNYDYDIGPPTVIVPSPFGSGATDVYPHIIWNNRREEPTSHVERLSGKKLLFETDMARLSEAKAMFYVGERCRRGGDLDMACRCYENAYRLCPQCRHGKKALQRMRRVKEQKQLELQESSISSDLPFLAAFPAIQPEQIRAFEKIEAEESGSVSSRIETVREASLIEIVLEESRPMLEGDEEESECPLVLCGGTGPQAAAPPTLYVAPPARDLRLTDDPSEQALVPASASDEDLSDWLPQAVRLLRGAGSLRIDASRLGRLMSRGEGAIRALGCDLVNECGRSYVVYPARP
jgi:hypothetical protein